ncbi:MAG: RNA polymerase factor sigma-54 [Bacteroidetes bacterium]|nr:RNA polymerase factor sigma-54 [Bacteroidota bacterium]
MLRLTQSQKLQQKLSPAQVQYLQILQLPVIQLEQAIKDELELNPLLEEGMEMEEDINEQMELRQEEAPEKDSAAGDDDEVGIGEEMHGNADDEYSWEEFFENNEGSSTVNSYWDDEEYDSPMPATTTLRDTIEQQILMLDLTDDQREFAGEILWNIDDDGYLRTDFDVLRRRFNEERGLDIEEEEAESILHRVQRLEPPGIAARDLRECLLVQLDLLPNVSTPRIIAMRMLNEAYDAFTKKQFSIIMRKLHIDEDMLKRAFEIIRGLNPKPGEGESIESTNWIIPDFFVQKEDGEFIITLNDRGVPPLRVNKAYKSMLLNRKKQFSKDTRQFLRSKMEAAKWFIDSIQQRRNTMLAVMHSIIEHQRDWFEHGMGHLKPLIYKDIAEDIEMDISTISRVVNRKYVQTDWGVYELRYFFSEAITMEDGEKIANKEVMVILQTVIKGENPRKPYSDQALTNMLKEKGYNIARRTVSKYREAMGIPVARLRKQLK